MKTLVKAFYLGSDITLRMLTSRILGESKGIKELKEDINGVMEVFGSAHIDSYSQYDGIFAELIDVVQDVVNEFSPSNRNKEWDWFKEKVKEKKGYEEDIRALFILVDDLDRLLPEKAIKLLEAIRFYFSLPDTIIIMGINDKILCSSLEQYINAGDDFSAHEFLEKLFHLSIELPHYDFEPSLHKIHFAHVLKILEEKEMPEKYYGIFQTLDPLTHRKWIRIANRWEGFLSAQIDPAYSLCRAIFEECFPRTELFIRNFPTWKENFPAFYQEPPDDKIKETMDKIIDEDNAYFEFPRLNFERLIEEWGKIP